MNSAGIGKQENQVSVVHSSTTANKVTVSRPRPLPTMIAASARYHHSSIPTNEAPATSAAAVAHPVAPHAAASHPHHPQAAMAYNPVGGASAVQSAGDKRLSVSVSSTPPPKKRPYRRTKRPKNYNDKSTVTNASEETILGAPVNVYDAVLGEAEDLLRAAMEAQAMGRLKMAAAYQLLLHTRLVGLGKRFDRAAAQQASCDSSAASLDATPATHSTSSTLSSASRSHCLPQALKQLSSILPSNLEMDTAMVEHLARAAVELHHQRTGRKKSADGLLASPMTGMIGTPSSTSKQQRIGWTAEEKRTIQVALTRNPHATPAVLAKHLANKTEAQVRAYLKSWKQRQKGSKEMDQAMNPNEEDHDDEDDEAPKKRGGRGRKPPTTAMNTVPNANLDARSLLAGKPTMLSTKKPATVFQKQAEGM